MKFWGSEMKLGEPRWEGQTFLNPVFRTLRIAPTLGEERRGIPPVSIRLKQIKLEHHQAYGAPEME